MQGASLLLAFVALRLFMLRVSTLLRSFLFPFFGRFGVSVLVAAALKGNGEILVVLLQKLRVEISGLALNGSLF